ncbi:transcriptional regulator [Leuconostoc pseudomesenteroides]|uniref:LCP family protein n=1 Tax=Leuconostoc falkenbergense TaxID=2766470 RepID=UPI000A03BBA5|nr:LCP family protein [Leuconostoc falkenbergense]ORI51755.1 transcriptional regulator [Leuconostoc pseudomesenteroides]MCT4419744.1 LytR family transcriptional regulator [Leuconostoc falkenbergense]ORI54931.1 transcriptional regulator [Leuconostoc pseudomesenteroides]ORI75555.1 transcriptional regulator [Leuconostoc pseudomesenteroides]ORI81818.1 transcriptional regulator [Leuconostoc pseudomesenteroides]
MQRRSKMRPKKRHTVRNIILTIIGLLVVGGIATGSYAYYKVNSTITKMQKSSKTTKSADKLTSSKKPVSYLLLGTDTGELGRNYKGRTDAMIVMTINPKTNVTTMTSIPRDTLVTVSGQQMKINAAYAYGSADSAVSAVENLLNIDINGGYILINMGGLVKMVDAVGGVDVTSPLTFTTTGDTTQADSKSQYSFVSGKTYHMDGNEALAFSRMRHEDPNGDYGRQMRQQLVIKAVLKNSAKVGTLFNDSLLTTISNNVQTDVSTTSMKNLALSYRKAFGTVKQDQLKGTTQSISGLGSTEVMSQTEIERVHTSITQQMAQ